MSIYSPHEGREKQELYEWLKNFDLEGEWVILGDWNMVQRRKDTAGPTTLLQGFTQEKWRETEQKWQLQDMFLMSSEQKGPLFTRQVVRGDRLDQARLDRGYITRGGDWISAVKCVEHDEGEVLSDHIPVVIDIQLMRRGGRLNRRKGTYLKMDVDTLKNECRKNRVKSAWQSGWTLSQDPIIAWELAWGKVREEYKEFRREDKTKLSRLREMQAELGRARENISTTEEMLELAKLEREVKERETLEASIIRRRSRVNWIKEGEASTKYFFKCLKAKQAQDKIDSLWDQEENLITNEEGVHDIIYDFYTELYRQPELEVGTEAESRQVLSLLKNQVEEEDNMKLIAIPSAKELPFGVRGE
ncbi:hypothetical protein R1sor_024705 [Riccia sorocarpa]|uniref:Endonuclease/exonuclease/phosphatase domain-containing protein n=1 Tax=Riccia sorocarpa TaxID=122646 RepID=A0ABD3GTP5_9MARC